MDIYDLFLQLNRAGPGDRVSLDWAIARAGTPSGARVLDAGCGTGADLEGLRAAVPGARITALDASDRFIAAVRRTKPWVTAMQGDMLAPPAGPFDLIWSAGAVYNVGVGAALRAWRPVVAPGGRVAFSDLRARVLPLPPACAEYWKSEGIDELGDVDGLEAEVREAGWQVLDACWLSAAAWAAYYEPIEAALQGVDDADLIAAFKAEIANWRAHGDSFGYRLVVCAPRDDVV